MKSVVKVCIKCKKSLPLSSFSKNKNTNDGLQVWCKDCVSLWYKDNKDSHLKSSNDNRKKNPLSTWCNMVRASHKVNGFIVNITTKQLMGYIESHNSCEICGKSFDFTPFKGHATKDSPSLDRKYNENEIRIDNIMMLCNDCNRKKGDIPFDKYILYCRDIWNKFKEELQDA